MNAARSPAGVPDSRGLNLFDADPSYRGLLALHLGGKLYSHLEPQFVELGRLAGAELDELALEADRTPPSLANPRSVSKSESYQRLEQYAFGKFGLAAMSHRGGVLGWPEPLRPRPNTPSPTCTCRRSSASAARCR